MRLIDGDALKEKITVPALGGHKRYYVWTLIDECPTIEAEPVKRGKWEINSDSYYPYCSECKGEPEGGKMTNYCPNCGARMGGNDK